MSTCTRTMTSRRFAPSCSAAVLLCMAAALAGCGGGEVAAPRSETQAASHPTVQPLFDERGQPRLSAASLVPADTAARTRTGLYATRAQFDWEELTAGPYTILLDVDALGTVAATVQLAEQVRGLRDTRGLAFYVRARRPADAARVVDLLADDGFAPVFMIV